ncbi:hypothetical protein LCGC14_1255150 [marine sediment metagenome]|uniref:Uncharacterized protein n=1 Tax=marine sediment metagenome TaxID=412755 RepID=A0A0F9P5U9_9ZZZZ
MANNKNLNEDNKATRFSKDNQPEKRGRRPSSIKKYFKDNKISATDKALLFENILNRYTAKDLMIMVKTKEFPDGKEMSGLIWGFLIAWIADSKKGWSAGGIHSAMMDRRHGKTPDIIKHSGRIDYSDLSEDELDKKIDELLKERAEDEKENSD